MGIKTQKSWDISWAFEKSSQPNCMPQSGPVSLAKKDPKNFVIVSGYKDAENWGRAAVLRDDVATGPAQRLG